jgi:hypothetical protein
MSNPELKSSNLGYMGLLLLKKFGFCLVVKNYATAYALENNRIVHIKSWKSHVE